MSYMVSFARDSGEVKDAKSSLDPPCGVMHASERQRTRRAIR